MNGENFFYYFNGMDFIFNKDRIIWGLRGGGGLVNLKCREGRVLLGFAVTFSSLVKKIACQSGKLSLIACDLVERSIYFL